MDLMRLCTMISVALVSAAFGQTAQLQIQITNAPFWDLLRSPFNEVRYTDVAAELGYPSGTRVEIIGVGWDLEIATVGWSWLSEATILFEDDGDYPFDQEAFNLTPGIADNYSGQSFYSSSIVLLQNFGLPNLVLDDGVLRLEFFETFDDVSGSVDAFSEGMITLLTIADLGPCSDADLAEPFGTMDLSDIVEFTVLFSNLDPQADLAQPFGTFDLADIVEFITQFLIGCP